MYSKICTDIVLLSWFPPPTIPRSAVFEHDRDRDREPRNREPEHRDTFCRGFQVRGFAVSRFS